jgi:hypothetical protein
MNVLDKLADMIVTAGGRVHRVEAGHKYALVYQIKAEHHGALVGNIPIDGTLDELSKIMREVLRKLGKKYGPCYIDLNSAKLILGTKDELLNVLDPYQSYQRLFGHEPELVSEN